MTLSSKPIQALFKKMWKLSWVKGDPQAQQPSGGSGDSNMGGNSPVSHTDNGMAQDMERLEAASEGAAVFLDSAVGRQGEDQSGRMDGIDPGAVCPAQTRTWSAGSRGRVDAFTLASPPGFSQQLSLRGFTKARPLSQDSQQSSHTVGSGALFLQPCAAPAQPFNASSSSPLGREGMKRKDSFVSTLGRSVDGGSGIASVSGSAMSVDGKIDILSCLPYEIAMVIVIYADFPTITTIAQVSRSWRRFAIDNAVWRRLFLQQQEWRTPRALAAAGWHARGGRRAARQRRRGNGGNGSGMEDTGASSSACSTGGMNTPTIGEDLRQQAEHPLVLGYAGSSLRPALALQHMVAPSPPPPADGAHGGRVRGADWRHLFQQRRQLDRNWAQGVADMHVITGHGDSVYCVQADHDKIVTGSRDRTVKMWDSRTFECLRTLAGHDASVLCLKYDASAMVTGSSDATVILWDWESGTPALRLASHSAGVLDVAFDAEYIVSCSKDCSIKVWQRSTGKLVRTILGHRGPVNAVQLRGSRIVSASGDSLIKMWDIRTGELLRTFAGHTRGLACVQFDGKTIVSGSSDQLIKVWDADSGRCLQTLRGHTDLVRTLHFNGGRRAVSGSYDQSIKVWDIVTGQCTLDLKDVHTSWVFDVQFSASRIVSTSQDQKIIVWDFSKNLDVGAID
ncbi:hypothetical protein EV177_002480 [Coemansia sp. RSA 1804]|nr:hypothetical protein EV177_002480 [Coemansia sp. RSA 1804]